MGSGARQEYFIQICSCATKKIGRISISPGRYCILIPTNAFMKALSVDNHVRTLKKESRWSIISLLWNSLRCGYWRERSLAVSLTLPARSNGVIADEFDNVSPISAGWRSGLVGSHAFNTMAGVVIVWHTMLEFMAVVVKGKAAARRIENAVVWLMLYGTRTTNNGWQ